MLLYALLCLIFATYAAFALLLLYHWERMAPYSYVAPSDKARISVVIPVRNEAENIGKLLADLRAQSYRNFEVLVIDDHSTDGTANVVRQFQEMPQSPSIRLLPLGEKHSKSHKKAAISLAIAHADGQLILTTDGDCRVGPHWLRNLHAFYQQEKPKLVSASVTFHESSKLFEQMQTVEFMSLIGTGAVSMALGKPNMCNGANLMYEKEAFAAVNGFDGAWHLASGDDEFLMHKIHAAFPGQVRFLKSTEAVVSTGAHETFKGFFYQRKRWASKWNHYTNPTAIALALSVFAFHLLCVALAVASLFSWKIATLALPLLALKMLAEWPYLYRMMRFHGHKNPNFAIFCTALLHSFYIVGIGAAGKIGGYTWKGRAVR